jgi:glutaminase
MRALEELHAKVSAEPLLGAVADYIPELSKADPRWFGIAVATADGQLYTVGDVSQRFTIQSISKPFVYGFVLEALGLEETLSKVGVEPSGEAFNSISLYPDTGRPYNPMINAGAIACTGLFHTLHGERTIERLVQRFSRLADRNLEIDRAVCDSERSTGHRNRAIAHLLRNFDILTGDDVERTLDAYFAQCSILVNTRDLAIIGATLANHGRNPVSDQVVMAPQHVHHVLSVMSSCGVYDYSGEWGFRVGLPAKSGVGGGILAVLPGQLAIAVFSPPLDARGNSARGIRVCEELARRFQLHMLRTPRIGGAVIRKDLSAAESASASSKSAARPSACWRRRATSPSEGSRCSRAG